MSLEDTNPNQKFLHLKFIIEINVVIVEIYLAMVSVSNEFRVIATAAVSIWNIEMKRSKYLLLTLFIESKILFIALRDLKSKLCIW